ncbi:MAG: hypothetical protein IJW70_08390 [Clostridia bacterium]|nr:hypothetical protein [Clostridia bacterium]
MKKTLAFLLCLLMVVSILTACNSTPDTEPQDSTELTESDTQPTIPPEQAPPPEQVIEGLAPDAVIMEIGTATKQVLLTDLDWTDIQNAFTSVGYADVNATLLEDTKLETRVLYGKDVMVTLQKAQERTYAILEPYNESILSVLTPNEQTGTGEATLAQIGIARIDEDDNPLNGMSYMFKLSDGSAVVIDGGFNNKKNRQNLMNVLEKYDIAKTEDGKYCITAWIFSHGHKDHRAAFTGIGKNFGDQISLKYTMFSFPPSPGTLTASTFDSVNFENKMYEYFPGVQHIVPHAGLAYHFGNLTVEVLYAPEMMYAPDQTIGYYNDTSLIMIADCAGARTLFMGDAGEAAATLSWNNNEKAAFKADMLQITHHGFNTAESQHKWKNIKQIYVATGAELALLPITDRLQGDERNGRYTVIVGHGGANYQMSMFVNKRDKPTSASVTQDLYNEFVAQVAEGTNTYPTLFGYDGINKIVSDKGIVTYIAGNETEPMITLFSLSSQGVSMIDNQTLAEWLD